MERIKLEELRAEIKANIVPFFSITMFVCLGIALFVGIHWSGVALRTTADEAFEAGFMHDVELAFPYGITDENLDELRAIEGVSDVEPDYVTNVIAMDGAERYVLRMQGLTERIDTATVVEGRLPQGANEVALLSFWAQDHGYAVGDTLVLKNDNDEDDSDADGMKYLTSDRFTVVGLVEHPAYLSKIPNTIGVANIGTGMIDSVGFVADEAFEIDEFRDSYPMVLLRCEGLREYETFGNQYKEHLAVITDKVMELGGRRASERYHSLRDDAQHEIADAEDKIADGESKLTDAEQRVEDGHKEIADSERKIADGEKQLAEGKKTLDDAAAQLAEGKKRLDDAEAQLAEGERQLREGEAQLSAKESAAREADAEARAKLDDAKQKLEDAQQEYDEKLEQYETGKELIDQLSWALDLIRKVYGGWTKGFEALKTRIDALVEANEALAKAIVTYQTVDASEDATEAEREAAWAEVETAYSAFEKAYTPTSEDYERFAPIKNALESLAQGELELDESIPVLAKLMRDNLDEVVSTADDICNALLTIIEKQPLEGATREDGSPYYLIDLPEYVDAMKDVLASSKAKLDEGKEKLDAGWAEYYRNEEKYQNELAAGYEQLAEAKRTLEAMRSKIEQGRAELDAGKQEYNAKLAEYEQGLSTYSEKVAELEDGKKKLEEAKSKIADAEKQLEEKRKDLKEAKAQVDDARRQLEGMIEYEWIVSPRLENGSAQSIQTVSIMMGNVRWAMALLFVLVGLFVCYSAVSRLVHDEVTQVGTKKANGFHESEISSLYLSFSGIAVLVGTVGAGLAAIFVVETIINPSAAKSFALPAYPPYFDMVQLLIGGAIEMVLILLSTWIAIHGLLKHNAIELLNGGPVREAKEHFYERWGIWKRMSLYSQTIVNNLVNERRRVVATLIGVIGCTALIVTAVTLSDNVKRSLERQYEAIYSFDADVYFDHENEGAEERVSSTLREMGHDCVAVHMERVQVREDTGNRVVASLYVPDDYEKFNEYYHLISIYGDEVELGDDGIWVSDAYADHMHVGIGGDLTLTDGLGRVHTFNVAGIFEYHLLRHEFVLDKGLYRKAFASKPEPNVLLVDSGGEDLDQMRDALQAVDGYEAVADDAELSRYAYGELAQLLNTTVGIYLVLSALMAALVLLNLDIMYVNEKKRELIVLMINGFDVSDAKAYIYRDSIALTVIGVLLGVVFGSLMGSITVQALEPSYGSFLRGFNVLAAGAGVIGASVFSTAVMLYALRRIPRFNLTDINRY